MSFRKFTEYGAASRTSVTIRTNDLLFISKAILNQLDVDEANYVMIFIDEEEYLLGLIFTKEKPNDNYRKISNEKSGVSVNIAPILRFFGITKLKEKFTSDVTKKEGMLVFSIKDLVKEKAM